MKRRNFSKFEHPYIIGLVHKNVGAPKYKRLQQRFTHRLNKEKLPFVYLLLATEPKHLKNLLTCMRAMDVVGVNLIGDYEKAALKFLDKLDPSAKAAKRVNFIINSGHGFIGYYVEDMVEDSVAISKGLYQNTNTPKH